jgi:hypothetical protein
MAEAVVRCRGRDNNESVLLQGRSGGPMLGGVLEGSRYLRMAEEYFGTDG